MATAFDTDLQTQFIEASSRALTASAELYTQVLTTQAEATRSMFEAFSGIGAQAARTGAETTEQAAETTARTTTRAARSTARTAKRTTRRAAGATRRATKPAAQAARTAAKTVAEPPVAGYDDLTADEIVAKLPEQPQTALAGIATYEKAKENRATVLQRVAALTGPEPAPGYDELNAEEAQQLVTDGNADLAATVRDYERRHKDRASVVEAAVRRADAS